MQREADAIWKDGPYAGTGTVSTPSRVLNNSEYAFGMAATKSCTTPGELLAAAISSSMSTVVALKMAELGVKPETVETRAVVNFDNTGKQWRITSVHLEVCAQASEAATQCFQEAVEAARRDCPIASELSLEVTCTAKLVAHGVPAV